MVQLQMLGIVQFFVVPEPPCCDVGLRYALDYPLLAVPMLLFMLGLAGLSMYTRQQRALSKVGHVGITVALVGIIVAIAHVFLGEYWRWWFGGWWYGGYGRLFDPYSLPPDGLLWVLWYASFGPGLPVLGVGLAILGLTITKSNVLGAWSVSSLIVTSLNMSIMPVATKVLLLLERARPEIVVNNSGIFMAILALFGLVWISVGMALWRVPDEDQQTQRTEASRRPRPIAR
jgi:hypothetical protein